MDDRPVTVRLVLDHALSRDGLALERVEWQCYAGSWASWRAAWRVGFRLEGAVRGGALQRDRRADCWVGTLLRDHPRVPVAPWPATSAVSALLSGGPEDVGYPAPSPTPG